jgi:hypothetical protein
MKAKFKSLIRTGIRSKLAIALAVASLLIVLMPSKARGQLGLDPCCAIIEAGLNAIAGLLRDAVATPLASIQQIRQQEAAFEQQVIYPSDSIGQAQGLAKQFQTQFVGLRQLYATGVQSATLANPQQLEQTLLSRDPVQIANVSSGYNTVFGPVMAPANAPQALRDVVDASDAEAQAAMKKAIEVDALADLELQAAEQINQQLQGASPGSAPILEAQAAAWVVRASSYSQSAMAELMRLRSIQLANEGAHLKFSTSHTTTLRNNLSQSLEKGQ